MSQSFGYAENTAAAVGRFENSKRMGGDGLQCRPRRVEINGGCCEAELAVHSSQVSHDLNGHVHDNEEGLRNLRWLRLMIDATVIA